MRTIKFAAMALGFMFVLASCVINWPMTAEDDAFKRVFDRHRRNIIVDGAQRYRVVAGDTLNQIAADKYGSGFYYPLILMASSDVVQDPDRIAPGMRLTIPDLQRNLDNPRARASLISALREVAVLEDERNRGSTARGLRELADTLDAETASASPGLAESRF